MNTLPAWAEHFVIDKRPAAFLGLGPSGLYAYRMTSTRDSSDRLGPCEICSKYAIEVFYQRELTAYTDDEWVERPTYNGCNNYFGHAECLATVRR